MISNSIQFDSYRLKSFEFWRKLVQCSVGKYESKERKYFFIQNFELEGTLRHIYTEPHCQISPLFVLNCKLYKNDSDANLSLSNFRPGNYHDVSRMWLGNKIKLTQFRGTTRENIVKLELWLLRIALSSMLFCMNIKYHGGCDTFLEKVPKKDF